MTSKHQPLDELIRGCWAIHVNPTSHWCFRNHHAFHSSIGLIQNSHPYTSGGRYSCKRKVWVTNARGLISDEGHFCLGKNREVVILHIYYRFRINRLHLCDSSNHKPILFIYLIVSRGTIESFRLLHKPSRNLFADRIKLSCVEVSCCYVLSISITWYLILLGFKTE